MKDIGLKTLSNLTVFSKYAKYIPEKQRRESWDEIVDRYQEMLCMKYPSLSDEIKNNAVYIRQRKVLPSMRALQFAGRAMEVNNARGFNCSYLPIDSVYSFSETMFLLLGGTGVGYSVQKHHVAQLPAIKIPGKQRTYLIEDSIMGWADSVKVLIKAYLEGTFMPKFDFRAIRPKGTRLITAGGKAPGSEPLKLCLAHVQAIFDRKKEGEKLSSLECHDVLCHISNAVLAGGIRRSACISLFSKDDEEMLTCKTGNWWELNEQRGRCNNSVVLNRKTTTKEEFDTIWKRIENSGSGEPGIYFTNNEDLGTNPCAEISLKPFQFCNLSEINVGDIESQEDLNNRASAASFFGTLQAGFTDFHYLRPIWKKTTEEDALIGVGMTGIGSGNILNFNLKEAASYVNSMNEYISGMIDIKPAARTTTIKPSGCQVKDTMLVTTEGILSLEEIGDINSDQEWQEHNISILQKEKYTNSNFFYINGFSNTKKITTSSGLVLESTLNHKYEILENKKLIWKTAEELKIGDILPYKIGGYENTKETPLIQIINRTTTNIKKINQPKILNKEFAWLLGLYFGDGSTHKKGIRIAGDANKIDILKRAEQIIKTTFGLNSIIYSRTNGNNVDLYVNSQELLDFLRANDLIKQKSLDLEFPILIRKASKEIIKSFIDGYAHADGSFKTNGLGFCTVSKKWAMQLTIILRALGEDAKLRLMPPTATSLGNNMRYWISVRKGRNVNLDKIRNDKKLIWDELDALGLSTFSFDVIEEIEDSSNFTYDIEVPVDNYYIANSYISHNTTSCVLGTASGIHAWYASYYLRTMRFNKNEEIATHLTIHHPELCEDDVLRPHDTLCVRMPIKAPEGAMLRTESALDTLERIKKFFQEWIKYGHFKGDNTNNVSATVSIDKCRKYCNIFDTGIAIDDYKNPLIEEFLDGPIDEWKAVGEWMWENREYYNGISVLPYFGGTYKQMPFEEITKEEYDERINKMNEVDFTKVIEHDDNVEFTAIAACAGGQCSID